MFTLKLLLKRSCWTFIFMALALPVSARVCFLPDSTDCGEGDVNVPDVQVTCATYGGYETPEACLAALKGEPAQTCILNSGCYYPKCAYDSERNCKRENPDKNCLSKDVEGVKCWYSQLKTCLEQGYKSKCDDDEDSGNAPSDVKALNGPCYICTPKKNCNQLPGEYYGPKDTCPQYHDREDAGISAKDGKCSVCKPQACTTICKAIGKICNNNQNKDTCVLGYEIVDGTNDAVDGPCYTCKLGTVDIVKPVITITYKETYHSLTPNTSDSDPDSYYYKTLKFTATSSDTINRTIQMKTYPTRTCKLKYQTGSPVTINEGVETTYASSCGVSSELLPVTSTAALDVFIDNKQVYSLEPYYSIKGDDFAQLDGKTVEAQGYTLKFVKGKTCSESSKGFWIGEKDKNTCPTGYKPEVVESTVGATVYSDGPCYKCTIGNCFGKESKIYYVTYGQYLQGNVAYQSACQCSSYLVKGNSPNITPLKPGGPIKINAISTPGGGSSSTEKIKLPTILTGVSSSNPYSVRIQEYNCLGDEHCSAQAVKFDVFEKYAPDTAKSLKEDDYFFDGVGVATTFEEGLYFYTGRPLKPKSQSINTCDDYVVILGNGNPKACAQKSSDYYNYQEACPKGLEKKRLPNVYDSTGAQCYTCEKPV